METATEHVGRRLRRGLWIGILIILIAPVCFVGLKFVKLASHPFFRVYLSEVWNGEYDKPPADHLIFVFADHWEPGSGQQGCQRAIDWLVRYRAVAKKYHDSQGRMFQYTWFYPLDNLEPQVLLELAQASHDGYGEIEVHWHHKHKSPDIFERDLQRGLKEFVSVGALVDHPRAQPRWAFIHGNWSLDNSRGDRFCGINNELEIFLRNGCYMDMTFPSGPPDSQPHMVNKLYYAKDTPEPKSYDTGQVATLGSKPEGLMMFEGPWAISFMNPLVLVEYGALDNAEATGLSGMLNSSLGRISGPTDYFRPHRVEQWYRLGIGVKGKPEWAFIKIYAHGIMHDEVILDGGLASMLSSVEKFCNQHDVKLHYVTAREAYNLVKAAEAGVKGSPELYYDFKISRPFVLAEEWQRTGKKSTLQ